MKKIEFVKKLYKKHYVLVCTLILSLVLNTIGLYPNTFFHPNEPGVTNIADQLIANILFKGDPDPNLKPDPFKYGSFIFYNQAFARGTLLISLFLIVKFTGISFGFDPAVLHASFHNFITITGPDLFGIQLLWTSRFLNALYGVGCVFLVYLICQQLFKNKRLTLISSFALAVMPHFVRDSHYSTADIILAFSILLSFLFTVRFWQKNTLKNLILAGIFAGFSSALKYYPLSFVPLFIVLLSFGLKKFIARIFIVIFSGIMGYVVAMPYIFIHYDKIFAFIPYVLWWQAPDQLDSSRPLWSRFLPTYYHQYPLKFMFNEGILPLPFIFGMTGIAIGFLKKHPGIMLVSSIVIFHFLFVNFYVKQIYEYILTPMLPFFAILIGISVNSVFEFLQRSFKRVLFYRLASVALILVVFVPSFNYSLSTSYACGKEITDYQARDWILKNIPENSRVAYHKGTRHPSMEMRWIETDILTDFSLAEIQDKNAEYMIFIDGYTSVYTYWSDDFFNPPGNLFNNQYVKLVENEFKNLKQVAQFKKPYLCAGNIITIYEVPPKLKPAVDLIYENNLNTISDFQKFKLLSTQEESLISFEPEKGFSGNSSLRFTTPFRLYNNFRNTYFYYSTPVFSEYIGIEAGKKYTASLQFKPESQVKKTKKDGYLRIDFYKDRDRSPFSTTLSPKGNTENNWQELTTIGTAPEDAKFVTVGFQSLSVEDNQSFLIDDIRLYKD